MILKKGFILLLVATLSVHCKKDDGDSDSSGSEEDPSEVAEGTLAIETTEADGVFTGAFVAESDQIQLMALDESAGDLAGSYVEIAPGTLAVDSAINVKKADDIGGKLLKDTGIDNEIEDSGPAVSVTPETAQNPTGSLKIGIPAPESFDGSLDNLAVAYSVQDADSGKSDGGLLPPGDLTLAVSSEDEVTLTLTLAGSIINFSTDFFGTFQTLKLKNPLKEKVVVKEVTDPDTTGDDPEPTFCELNKETDLTKQLDAKAAKLIICNPGQLNLLAPMVEAETLDVPVELGADIDMTGKTFNTIGSSDFPFVGTLDGANHIIKGLKLDGTGGNQDPLGFITDLGDGGVVQNIRFEGIDITNDGMTGGVAAYNNGGTITNVHVSGSIIGDTYVGSIVGRNQNGEINQGALSRVSSSATVNGYFDVGGIAGYNAGSVKDALFIGSVIGDNASTYAAGLVAFNDGGLIERAYTAALVNSYVACGFVCSNYGTINDSFSATPITTADTGARFVSFNNTSPSPAVVDNSHYVELACSSSCSEAGGTEAIAQASESTLYTKDHAVFASWDFTATWKEVADSFPTMDGVFIPAD